MASILNATTTSGLVTSADNSGSLQLQTNNGTTAVTIDASQNVGIGTTSTLGNSLLNVAQGVVARNSGGTAPYLQLYNANATTNQKTWRIGGSPEGQMVIDTVNDAYSAATERMRIDSSGNVLIGGTSTAPFSGTSGLGVTRATTPAIYISQTQNTGGYTAKDYVNYIAADGSLAWYDTTALAERMRIDSSGNLYLNTTTQNDSGKFNINFNSTVNIGIGFKQTNGGTTGTIINCFNSSTQTGSITQNATNVQFNTSSDYRLKDNITPMVGALERVQQLKPVTWTWKVNGDSGQGFIAHELAEICPDAVHGEKDAVDAEGNPKYQGVDASFLIATLTAAIQELKAELDTVKAELNTLKNLPVEGTE